MDMRLAGIVRGAFAMICCACAVGCADPEDGSGDGVVDTDPVLADEIEADVVGFYVTRTQIATLMELPVVGESESISVVIGVARVERVDDRFDFTQSGCHIDSIIGDDAVKTTIGDVVPRSVEPMTTGVPFARENNAVVWHRRQRATLYGVRLDNPATDDLPADATNPRVWDQDGDGNPGITVTLEGIASGDIYAVQRDLWSYYAGAIEAPGSLTALLDATSEQVVVGASNPLLTQALPAQPHPDATMSNIAMKRVAEEYDCDRAVAEADTLFR